MGQILCVKKVPFRKSGHICGHYQYLSRSLELSPVKLVMLGTSDSDGLWIPDDD